MEDLIAQVVKKLKERGWKLVTAESCTGGGVAYMLTSMPGSSEWYERGYVTYSNASKQELLGVQTMTLDVFGAVSEQAAREMANGALKHSIAQVSLAITGIAGPDGGTPDKPVGTVWFGWSSPLWGTKVMVDLFSGNRKEIREQSIRVALERLVELLSQD